MFRGSEAPEECNTVNRISHSVLWGWKSPASRRDI